jgi:glucokinase
MDVGNDKTMMAKPLAVGVDVGGTKIGFTLIDRSGDVQAASRMPTPVAEGVDAVLDQIAAGIRAMLDAAAQPIVGIGIGFPGHIDLVAGVVRQSSNLGWWDDVPLRDAIRQRLQTNYPIWLGIDANANVLGELYFGAAQGYRDVIFVTIGTGLGGSAIVGGKLVLGTNDYAMEIGHVQLDADGRQCRCGMRGCPEMYVSGIGLLAGVRERASELSDSLLHVIEKIEPKHVLEAARIGDNLALSVMNEARDWLFRTLAYTVALFNPELLIIGGGLGLAAADFFVDGAYSQIARRTVSMSHHNLRVRASQVTNSAIGAACLVWHELDQQLS